MAAYTTIDDPSAYFKVQLYTGNGTAIGSGGNAITFNDTDTDMQPDFVWIKCRSAGEEHVATDSVRGVTKIVRPNGNYAETTAAEGLNTFGSDGFTVGNSDQFNTSSGTYVAWCWKAGTTSGINTTGSDITPDAYSFNQTSGFSIIKYEGNDTADTQLAHGIGAVPKFALFKKLESTGRYQTYHHVLDTDEKLYLDDTHATVTDADAWNETDPTAVNWTIDIEDDANENGEDLVAYSWAPVQGYSAMGSYIGNGNADGTFVYTGFKPAFIIIKRTDSTSDWSIFDNKREGYNDEVNRLKPNGADAEEDDNFMDIVSNGFKLRITSASLNASGGNYVYAAFAESPFVNSNGVPTTGN